MCLHAQVYRPRARPTHKSIKEGGCEVQQSDRTMQVQSDHFPAHFTSKITSDLTRQKVLSHDKGGPQNNRIGDHKVEIGFIRLHSAATR